MPTNEYQPEDVAPEPMLLRRAVIRSRDAIGASDRMPVRVIVLFIIIAACVTLAQVPFNIVGVAAVALLALDTAMHRR